MKICSLERLHSVSTTKEQSIGRPTPAFRIFKKYWPAAFYSIILVSGTFNKNGSDAQDESGDGFKYFRRNCFFYISILLYIAGSGVLHEMIESGINYNFRFRSKRARTRSVER